MMEDFIRKTFNPSLKPEDLAIYLNENLVLEGQNDFSNVHFYVNYGYDEKTVTSFVLTAEPKSTLSYIDLSKLQEWRKSLTKIKNQYKLRNGKRKSIAGIVISVIGGIFTVWMFILLFVIKVERDIFFYSGLVIDIGHFIGGLAWIIGKYFLVKKMQNDDSIPIKYLEQIANAPEYIRDYIFLPEDDGITVSNAYGEEFYVEGKRNDEKEK